MKKYQIFTPDGITIEKQKYYRSMKKAYAAFINWLKQFERQGYYSSNHYGRIPLNELESYCQFKLMEK